MKLQKYPIGVDIANLYNKPKSKLVEDERMNQFLLEHKQSDIPEFDRYYTYIYLDPRYKGNFKYGNYKFDYAPFYVGKGMFERCFAHIFERGNSLKHRNIYAIKSELNRLPIIMKLNDNVPEFIAFEVENYLIDQIGRINKYGGILTNKIAGNKFKV